MNKKTHSQHSMLHDEDDLVRSSDHESDDGSRSDDGPDIDEYANLDRDLEKYENDRVRWNGIENVRKYHIAKKKSKVEDQKKRKDNGEEEAKRTTKPRKQDKPKALPKSRRKGSGQALTSIIYTQNSVTVVELNRQTFLHHNFRNNSHTMAFSLLISLLSPQIRATRHLHNSVMQDSAEDLLLQPEYM